MAITNYKKKFNNKDTHSPVKAVIKIKTTEIYFNYNIFIFKRQMQIVTFCSLHFFAKCTKQSSVIKILIMSDKIFILQIILNPSNLKSFLVLILARVQLEDCSLNSFVKKLRWTIVIMNLVVIAQFFKIIYTSIFKHILAVCSTQNRFFRSVLTYFRTVETNG